MLSICWSVETKITFWLLEFSWLYLPCCLIPFVLGYTELQDGEGLSISTDMNTIVKAMAAADSGLDVRDRMWLKITIPNAFIGKSTSDDDTSKHNFMLPLASCKTGCSCLLCFFTPIWYKKQCKILLS